jgi:protoheme IX farnesyltransferase
VRSALTGPRSLAADLVSAFKLRIGVVITASALGGIAVTPGPLPEAHRVGLLALAVFMASAASGAFNQLWERGLDARMRRTARRPFVAGRLRAGPLWYVSILLLLIAGGGLAAAAANPWAAGYTLAGALTYALVYTVWLKPRTWLNIVVGGLAGSFAVLAGAAAVDPDLAPEPVLLAIVLFLWTPPHFWALAMAAKEDYARCGVPMLPVVMGDTICAEVVFAHALALSAIALLPALFSMGVVYLAAAVAGGTWFSWKCWRLVREPTKKNAIEAFLASLSQLSLLLAGAVADRLLSGIG